MLFWHDSDSCQWRPGSSHHDRVIGNGQKWLTDGIIAMAKSGFRPISIISSVNRKRQLGAAFTDGAPSENWGRLHVTPASGCRWSVLDQYPTITADVEPITAQSAQWELRPSPCDPGCRWPQSSDIPGSDYYQTWHINFMRGVGPVRRDTVSNKATVMFRVHALQYSTRCMHIFSSITRLFRGLSFVFRL